MPSMAKQNKERHCYSMSLFFHYKYVVIGGLLLCILGIQIAPLSTSFTPLFTETKSYPEYEQILKASTDTLPREAKPSPPVANTETVPHNATQRYNTPQLFNPDTATEQTWKSLGFSPKQATVILKYRTKIGGFQYKEQLADCFVISEKDYNRIAPYILLPNRPILQNTERKTTKSTTLFRFNPDTASAKTFQAVGFTERQARVLIHFRDALGGKFGSAEQLGKSYVVDSATLERLRPYLVFE